MKCPNEGCGEELVCRYCECLIGGMDHSDCKLPPGGGDMFNCQSCESDKTFVEEVKAAVSLLLECDFRGCPQTENFSDDLMTCNENLVDMTQKQIREIRLSIEAANKEVKG